MARPVSFRPASSNAMRSGFPLRSRTMRRASRTRQVLAPVPAALAPGAADWSARIWSMGAAPRFRVTVRRRFALLAASISTSATWPFGPVSTNRVRAGRSGAVRTSGRDDAKPCGGAAWTEGSKAQAWARTARAPSSSAPAAARCRRHAGGAQQRARHQDRQPRHAKPGRSRARANEGAATGVAGSRHERRSRGACLIGFRCHACLRTGVDAERFRQHGGLRPAS